MMIKSLSLRTCAFDAEWVACPDTARRLLDLPPDIPDGDAMEALWHHYATDDDERPFLKLALSMVVSIAAVVRTVNRDGSISLSLVSRALDECSEGEMIGSFLETVAKKRMQLWGFYSGGADVPLLVQRAIALGVPCPTFSKRPPKPWEGPDYFDNRNSTAHMDILHILAGFARGAARPSLDEFAAACGIPGKLDVAGGDVAGLFLDNDIRTIANYNETDALTTHLIMLRIGLHSGHLSADQYRDEVDAVDSLLEQEIAGGKEHLERFQLIWHSWRFPEVIEPGPSLVF